MATTKKLTTAIREEYETAIFSRAMYERKAEIADLRNQHDGARTLRANVGGQEQVLMALRTIIDALPETERASVTMHAETMTRGGREVAEEFAKSHDRIY